MNIANATLIALAASLLVQVGAQLFAIAVMARTYLQAPPRSFAILEGEFGYSSGAFWDIVPMVTSVLFLAAIAANWKTRRRGLLLASLGLFILCAVVAGVFMEPAFAEMIATGYHDTVDPALQERAAFWYRTDWGVWLTGLVSGILVLAALARPVNPVINRGA
jgi:hypothetical protein